jgi:hypothetical protein
LFERLAVDVLAACDVAAAARLLRLLRSKERLKDERERAEPRWAIVHMSDSPGSPG